MSSNRRIVASRVFLAVLVAGLGWGASRASAVVLAPGASSALTGTNTPGLVIQDPIRSLTLSDGTVIGVQDRVDRLASGNLEFDRVVRNTSNVTITLVDVVTTGFAGFTTDVDFDPTSTGTVGEPHFASRSASGNAITFTQMASPTIVAGNLSRFMDDITNATSYTLTGTTTVDALNVAGAPITGSVSAFAPAVPEPASIGVMGIGATAAMLRRRRS